MSKNIGKKFEGKVQEALKSLQSKHPVMWYRFPDSTAARNAMTSQPGDHMLLHGGDAWLIEEKASEVHDSLKSGLSSLFSKKQAAMHLKWNRAGSPSMVIFHSVSSGIVEVWNGGKVSLLRSKGDRIGGLKPLAVFLLKDLEENLATLWSLRK